VPFRIATVVIVATISLVVAGIVTTNGASGASDASGPSNAPGRVLSVQERPGGGLDVRYLSMGVRGSPVEETAVVWLPPGRRTGDVVAWGHQTTGIADTCAPSAKAEIEVPGRAALLAAGNVVVAPDYEGLGTAGVHPYLVGDSEGRSILDAIRAARSIAGAHGRSAAYGWSQGGHAVLFAGKLAPTYAPDVRLAGVAAIAPVTTVSSLLDGSSPLSQVSGVVAMVTAGYVAAYPDLDPAAVLGEPDQQLSAARRVCDVAGALDGTPTKITTDLTWAEHLDENDPASSPIAVPMMFAQGEDDFLLPLDEAVTAAEQLCAQGSTVQLVRYPATSHASVPQTSLADVMSWIGRRLAGHPTGPCGQREGRAS